MRGSLKNAHLPPVAEMHDDRTIAALATLAGPAARLIVRTSGDEAFAIAARLGATSLAPNELSRATLSFVGLHVAGACYAFRRPRSHTGEDVVEYHLPGNPLLGRMLMDELVRLGARQATPGEFSARAFFNGRLRLDEAEGVAASIAACNDQELTAARRLRAGELARRLEPALETLADLLALCELSIDFSEEDVIVFDTRQATARLNALIDDLAKLRDDSPRLEQLGRQPRVALVGRPNAGKSTLLNALVGCRRAVASDVPGTTRDALGADIELPGGLVTLVDLAGICEGDAADGPIGAAAHRIALTEAATADMLVLVRDAADTRPDPPLPRVADVIVVTKMDLAHPAFVTDDLGICAPTGVGLDALRHRLDTAAFAAAGGESVALNARHRELIDLALARLAEARVAADAPAGAEIVSLHLRDALNALGGILGAITPDDVLGRIFGRFCIGK